jgi:hypothetical protein
VGKGGVAGVGPRFGPTGQGEGFYPFSFYFSTLISLFALFLLNKIFVNTLSV